MLMTSYLVCFVFLFSGQIEDDFHEVQQFRARFSEIANFEVTTPLGSDGVAILTFWRSKDGYVFVHREEFGENQKIEYRTIWNPYYMAKLEKKEEQWYLLNFFDNKSEIHKRSDGTGFLLANVFSPLLLDLLDPKNIREVNRSSSGQVEYYVSPESKFFTPVNGCDKVTIKFVAINNELLPHSIEYWLYEGTKAFKNLITVSYATEGLLPIETETQFSQAEMGIDNVTHSKISVINPDNFRSKDDFYLSGYGLSEPKGFSRGLSWTSWLWIFIGTMISSRLIWHYYKQRSTRPN